MLLDFGLKDIMNIKNSNKACDIEDVIFFLAVCGISFTDVQYLFLGLDT